MRYLQTYKQHNEGIKSALAGVGLAGSLLTGSPEVKAQDVTSHTQEIPQDGVVVIKNQAEELSKIRQSQDVAADPKLAMILDEIKQNINSDDQEKFVELFNKLSAHMEERYNYKIEAKKIEKLSAAGVTDATKGMSLFEIFGWLGSICLAICGIPQAFQSIKDKHSHGISWGFVLLWSFGEIFALAYVYDKLDLPLLLNYATNILILGIILYYKINPKNTADYDKEIRRFH